MGRSAQLAVRIGLLRFSDVRVLFVNPYSGDGRSEEVRAAAKRRGIRVQRLDEEVPGDAEVAILLVGNNVYGRLGRRARLDEGVLSVYATAGFIPRVAIERRAAEVEIAFPGLADVEAAVDGEAVTLPARL